VQDQEEGESKSMNNLPEEMMQNLKRRGKKSGFVMLLTSKA